MSQIPPYFVKPQPDGRWAFYVDSSMLNSYCKCPKLFWYLYICLQRRKGMAGAMSIGSWWSRTLELFYMNMQSRQAAGAGYVTREEMMAFAADSWTQCQNCKHQHLVMGQACGCGQCDCKENRNMNLLKVHNPKAFDAFGGAHGAIIMASEYYDRIGGIDNANLKIVASEAGFGLKGEMVLYEDSDIIVHYIGKPDLVVYDSSAKFLAPLDHKTVDRVRSDIQRKYKPHGQTAGYIWAVGRLAKELGYDVPVDRCIINICGRLAPAEKPRDGKPKPRFTRVYPTYSPDEIEEWRLSVVSKVHAIRRSIIHNDWFMVDSSCHLYGGCDFRSADSVAPANRSIILNADYYTAEPWIPYEVEDEDVDGA